MSNIRYLRNGATSAAFASLFSELAQRASNPSEPQQEGGRTTVELWHKSIPGADSIGNTNPYAYPKHAYVTVRDNVTGEEWIARAKPGGECGNAIFGSIKGAMTRDIAGSTVDYGAQVNHSTNVLTTDMAPQARVDQLSGFASSVTIIKLPITLLSEIVTLLLIKLCRL